MSYHYHIPTERHVSVFVSFQLVPINQLASPHHDVELCRHRKKKIPNLLYNRPTFLQFATNCLLFTFADFFFLWCTYLPLRLTWHVGQGQKFMYSAGRHSVLQVHNEDHLFILQSKHRLRLSSFFLIIAGTIICCASKRLSYYSIHDISISLYVSLLLLTITRTITTSTWVPPPPATLHTYLKFPLQSMS